MDSQGNSRIKISGINDEGDPVTLSCNESFRLLFVPKTELIANRISMCGKFVSQHKNRNDEWKNTDSHVISELHPGESFALVLSCEATRNLLIGLKKYQTSLIESGYVVEEQLDQINSIDLSHALKSIATMSSNTGALMQLDSVSVEELHKAAVLMNFMQLSRTLKEIEDGLLKDNDEDWWQNIFQQSPWLLAQLFAQPVVVLKEKAYMGGKNISNEHGKYTDFLLRNSITNNVAIIEIKTPAMKLLRNSEYRDQIFGFSESLDGAVTQVLTQKDVLYKFHIANSFDKQEHYDLFNPKCIVIAGTSAEFVSDPDRKSSFELKRSSFKDVEIITFDELVARGTALVSLLRTEPNLIM
jgi:hypothetical protein